MSGLGVENPTLRWFDERLPIISFMHHETVAYPTPKNFNYFWNFGALALFVLVVAILTGVFLVMNYTHASLAFDSVERIMRDVNHGWLIRYLHMNGASMFIIVYVHMSRSLLWISTKAPGGALDSRRCHSVDHDGHGLHGLCFALGANELLGRDGDNQPIFRPADYRRTGRDLALGGFSVGNPTLNRFFSLHYLLPFVLFAVVFLHLWALHTVKSNNPTGVDPKTEGDTVPFHPYYTIKDLFGVGVFLMFYCFFVFFFPDFYGEPDNYIQANPRDSAAYRSGMVLPAILRDPQGLYRRFHRLSGRFPRRRSDVGETGGVLAMFASIIVLCLLPWLDRSPVRSARYRPMYKLFFWLFLIDCLVLGYIGSQAAEGTKILIGQISTTYYFVHFLSSFPFLGNSKRQDRCPNPFPRPCWKTGVAPQGVA